MTKKTKSIKLSLLENAESFAAEGIEAAIRAERNPIEWKFAILHIVQALELVLKEILRREHEIFIYEDIDKPTKTVSILKAFERIKRASNNKFSEKDSKIIIRAVGFRNRFTHFDVEYNPIQMGVVFVEMFGFLQHCYSSFFDGHIKQAIHPDLWDKLTGIEKYVKKLYDQFKDKVNSGDIKKDNVFICPLCWRDSFLVEESKCYACGYEEPKRICEKCKKRILQSEDYYIFENDSYCEPCAIASDIHYYAHEVDMWLERFYNGDIAEL